VSEAPRTLTPASEEEVAAVVSEAAAAGHRLGVEGGGTRHGLGRPIETDATLSASRLTGVVFHEPAELVIAAKAGTPVREIEAALAEHGQMLAFEPMDHRTLFGSDGEPTIGGVVAVNASGPRRVKVGAARDALLGVRFVNGKGEIIKSGGRVMKNVTGLDLTKPLCGSHGTLGFLTEVVFKVLPRPERSLTVMLGGLTDADAIAALSSALGSPFEPSGAAHIPANARVTEARTLVRLEGFSDSVDHRRAALAETLARWGATQTIEGNEADGLWRSVRDAALLSEARNAAIWRIACIPSKAADLAVEIASAFEVAHWFFDLGGALIWLAIEGADDAGAAAVRQALAHTSGHATLVRAPDAIRQSVPVFQPQNETVAALTRGLKQSFDPSCVFQPGRMYADI